MGANYREYLASNIISEERMITYRLLSRALKVHVNTAKEMLYEFHRQQNGKKPGSIHATYLIAGNRFRQGPTTSQRGHIKDGEDAYMQSSPFRSSPAQQIDEIVESPSLSITLVKEEDLHKLQSIYESIASIHVYSLAPSPIKDLQILSDTARNIPDTYESEDSLKFAKTYGTIINIGARRRTDQRPSPALAPDVAAIPTNPPKPKLKTANEHDLSNASNFGRLSSKPNSEVSSSHPTKDYPPKRTEEQKNSTSTPSQLRRDSSNIFKSFAKAKPRLKREGTDSSVGTSGVDSGAPSGREDEPVKVVSEDEDDGYVPPPQLSSKENVETDRRSRKEREAALRKMMDDDDPEEDSPVKPDPADVGFHQTGVHVSQPLEEAVQSVGGRRRGRRRVFKKKTVKDEEGYLVTKEEPVWESFSEDEAVVVKSKTSSVAPSIDKMKKGPGKVGQGSIMSFFGKK